MAEIENGDDEWDYRSYVNHPEATVRHALHQRGWKVTKRGWPDFFCIDHKGRVCAVEVKPVRERLRASQVRVLRALTDAGIRCYVAVVNPQGHGTLQPFNAFRHKRGQGLESGVRPKLHSTQPRVRTWKRPA